MYKLRESKCSDEEFVTKSEELAKEIEDAMDQVKKDLSAYVNVEGIFNYILQAPHIFPDEQFNVMLPQYNDDFVHDDADEVGKRFDELCRSRNKRMMDEMKRIMKLSAYLMRPLSEPQMYCPWYDRFDQICSIRLRYVKRVRKALDAHSMALYNTLASFPLPNIDYATMVKQYKRKFRQQHIEAVNRKQGRASKN
ncbi:hypothetical protein ABFS82_14G029400 [Erythranthe guttata]|uniref:Uncharacterized protein n=1 Tax=Erythranthe guttata TaxID=4155 RepID=A0A022R1B2_ERYGU|nr:PREDICTED: uncharacterized protein LOC105963350 [Erythranthe guttata]EYU32595.1 hypothetical protein MIMGU_mgv1a014310mg [Erythranthe guttata]|eukprot:XP_012843197.1 PREDICTED: uncharacterized protein LOC105963350 [Erythranthe guttata]